MKLFRQVIFWCHLVAGVTAGVIILTMSVTGVLLTYEKQLTTWADTRNYRVSPPPGASRLPLDTVLANVSAGQAGAPVSVTARAERSAPIAFAFNNGRTLYANPYTGEVLGEGAPGVRWFFRSVTDWHRWLGADGAGRATGRFLTDICNLIFLFIVVSGFYLWWPRALTWPQFKNILWFRRRLRGKARDFNWHNVIGFWSLGPLFLIVLSGVVISYPWAGNLVYRAAGEAPPPRETPPTRPAGTGAPRTESPASPVNNLDRAWAVAEQYVPGWNSLSLRLPNAPDAPLVFTIDHGTGGQPQKRSTLTIDRKTGAVTKWEPFTSFTRGRRWRVLLRFTHTGEVGGIVGQTVAGLVSLGGAFLVLTGLTLTWRRFHAWRGRTQKTGQAGLEGRRDNAVAQQKG